MTTTDASTYSRLQEKILEHIFISDLLRALWAMGHRDMEVLRSEVDSGGYDVVLAHAGVVRHVQLKATVEGGKTTKHKVNTALGKTQSGCIVWLTFEPRTLCLSPTFRWFGAGAGEKLPDLSGYPPAKHTKANAAGTKNARPGVRVVPASHFTCLSTMNQLIEHLFSVTPTA